MAYVQVEPGVQMFYQDRGKGRPILFVHGWSMSHAVWDYAVMDLARDYRCISVDLRGFGASDKPVGSYTYDIFCQDIRSLLRALDLQGVTLVGWSMGGGISLKYAIEYGERVSKAVLVSPVAPRLTSGQGQPFGMPSDQAPGLLEATRQNTIGVLDAFLAQNFHKPGFEATQKWFLTVGMQMPVFVGYQTFVAMVEEDFTDRLGQAKCPVHVFHGRNDKVCDPRWTEFMVGRLPGLQVTWFEESGHVCFLEERDRFTQELLRVL